MNNKNQEERSNMQVSGPGSAANDNSISAGAGGCAVGRDVNFLIPTKPKTKMKYYIFLSCEHDEACNFIENSEIDQNTSKDYERENYTACQLEYICSNKNLIKKMLPGIEIEFINRHNSIKTAYQSMKPLYEHCIFIINYHRDANQITYFQLGYAKGKGIEVLGLCDGTTTNVLPQDIKAFIYKNSTSNLNKFVEQLKIHLMKNTKPMIIYDDPEGWNIAQNIEIL